MDDAIVEDEVVTPPPDTGETGSQSADPPPEWVINLVKWAGDDPWGFLSTLFLYLSPLFLISAFLSWKLAKMIENKEKEKKKTKNRNKNMRKVRAKIE